MSIWHPIAELRLFQNLTLKFKGQGHGWGHSSKSHCGPNILSTHIPFVPCQSALPFLTYSIFKIWPSKSRVKVMGEVTIQSHNVGLTSYRLTSLLFHVNRPSHSWVMTFFKIWPWNSKVKVMREVTVQSHNVGLTSYRLTSLLFHVNWPSHSWNTASSKFDLENQGSSQMTLMLHNYRSRQFHTTSNGMNPSSGSNDMGSAKSGPSAAWFNKFLANGQTHVGQMGK